MTTEQLGYVLEMYKCQSINRASKNLFVSQPSLSSTLKSLESELGYKIFERTSTGIRPTEQGLGFLQFAERTYSEYNLMRQTAMYTHKDNSLSITSACSSLYSHTYFTFKQSHPLDAPVTDVFREATIYPSLQDLESHLTRLVISYVAESLLQKYESYAHKHDMNLFLLKKALPIRIIVGAHHPLAQRPAIDVQELLQYPFITYSGIDHEDTLGAIGVSGVEVQYVSSRASFYDAIRIGNYVATSLETAQGEDQRMGFVCKPCKNYGDQYVATAFTNSSYSMSDREKEFIDYLKKRLCQI